MATMKILIVLLAFVFAELHCVVQPEALPSALLYNDKVLVAGRVFAHITSLPEGLQLSFSRFCVSGEDRRALEFIPDIVKQQFENFFSLCVNNTNETIYENLLQEMITCIQNIDFNVSICDGLGKNLQRCTQPPVDYLSNCFPEISKDVPQIIVNVELALLKAACTSRGEVLVEVLNPCIGRFPKQEGSFKQECKKEVFLPKLQNISQRVPTKSQMCLLATEILTCWEESVNESCESLAARELFSTFSNAVRSPCK